MDMSSECLLITFSNAVEPFTRVALAMRSGRLNDYLTWQVKNETIFVYKNLSPLIAFP